jgi:twinkle protein
MPNKGDIGKDKWNEVADHINSNFFFIDMERYTLESVLRKGAELVKRKGIKCLLSIHLIKLEM